MNEKKEDEWEEIKQFPCFRCDKGFDTYAGLMGHIASSQDHYGRRKAMGWLQDNEYWKKSKFTSFYNGTRNERIGGFEW